MNKKYFVARAVIGAEYMYSIASARAVSAANRDKISSALNIAKFELKPGQVWKIFECENTETLYYAFRINHGYIREYQILRGI